MADVLPGALAALLVLGAIPAALSGCSSKRETAVEELSGRARAEALVEGYARHVGAGRRGLDGGDDAAFGESGLHYDAARDVLVGRAFVQRVFLEDAPADEVANYRRAVAFLNDPKVGGMYDRGGGTFVLDEARNGYFLVREFPVATTDLASLTSGIDRMVGVAAPWVTTWLFEVAMVMHGKRPPPTRPVTLADRPR